MIEKSNGDTLTTYSILNALLEGTAFGILRYMIQPRLMGWEFLHYLLLYEVLAFALRPLTGILTDLVSNKHLYVQTGVLLVFCGLLFPSRFTRVVPYALGLKIKVCFAGIGFSLFRSAAEGSILRRSAHRARDIGIFLSTGAIGTAIVLLKPTFVYYFIPLAMFVASRDDRCREYGEMIAERNEEERKTKKTAPVLAAALLAALTVAMFLRSFLGDKVDIALSAGKKEIVLLSLALIAGRFFGGYLTDFVGPVTVSLTTLPASAYLLLTMPDSLPATAAAIFFLNLSLPALYHSAGELIPRAPAFAAGLLSSTLLPAAIVCRRFEIEPVLERFLLIDGAALNLILLCTAAIVLGELPVVHAARKKEGPADET